MTLTQRPVKNLNSQQLIVWGFSSASPGLFLYSNFAHTDCHCCNIDKFHLHHSIHRLRKEAQFWLLLLFSSLCSNRFAPLMGCIVAEDEFRACTPDMNSLLWFWIMGNIQRVWWKWSFPHHHDILYIFSESHLWLRRKCCNKVCGSLCLAPLEFMNSREIDIGWKPLLKCSVFSLPDKICKWFAQSLSHIVLI